MEKSSYINFAAILLLGVLIYASNFLNTDLFTFGEKNFAVWFVLSILCFANGWYINRMFGWNRGGRIVFAVIISVTVVSIFMVTFFADYFGANEILTENLILYSLRNITLGTMGIFGMAVHEVINNRRDNEMLSNKVELLEKETNVSKKEAKLIIKEANVEAKKIINDAEAKAKNTMIAKETIEKELKEFLQSERELIKRYEGK